MELNNESKTLFIPLLGKAIMSKDNLFLHDSKAEEIISKIDYDFNSLKQSKWLSMYMSVRALLIDELCNKYISEHQNATIIHLGCGLDSRCLRVNQAFDTWYDIDYENVIDIRKKFYDSDSKHKMIGSSVTDYKWLDQIKNTDNIMVVAEGLTMYLSEEEIKELVSQINNKLGDAHLLFDAYSKKGVRISKIKNPVNQMNAEVKYGIDNPDEFLSLNDNLEYVATHLIKKEDNNLHGLTKLIFNNLYCGKISQSKMIILNVNLVTHLMLSLEVQKNVQLKLQH
jgi:O-methyltransferase involved in polyketide biosynthesis